MLAVIATTNTIVGTGRRKPFEAPSAVAQTASSIPDAMSTIHVMTNPSESVLSWCGYCSLVRETCIGLQHRG
jgi:hypothetical protein